MIKNNISNFHQILTVQEPPNREDSYTSHEIKIYRKCIKRVTHRTGLTQKFQALRTCPNLFVCELTSSFINFGKSCYIPNKFQTY